MDVAREDIEMSDLEDGKKPPNVAALAGSRVDGTASRKNRFPAQTALSRHLADLRMQRKALADQASNTDELR
jgi:hypothetical protein